jgi:hypothetical protein
LTAVDLENTLLLQTAIVIDRCVKMPPTEISLTAGTLLKWLTRILILTATFKWVLSLSSGL